MFIDLRKTPEGLSSAKVVLSFSEEYLKTGEVSAEIPATVSVRRDGGRFFVTVEYVCKVAQECARCCSAFTYSVEGSVLFVVQSSSYGDYDDDDIDVYTYKSEDDRIDFSQSVYDDCMVRLPIKPLCDTICTGYEYSLAKEQVAQSEISDAGSSWSAALNKLKNR